MAYDWGKGAGGAGTGAIYGGQIGGPAGALIGGGLGALGGFFGDNEPTSRTTMDPQQKQLYEQKTQALQGGGGPLADVYGQYNPQMMKDYYEQAYAQPQYQEFQDNIVPTITGQFRGQNLQNSSYLGGALAKEGGKVQNNLNGQMAQMLYQGQQSQQSRRAGALDSILNLQSQVHERPQSSVFDNLLSSLSEGAGGMLSDYLRNMNKKTPALPGASTGITAPQPTIGG